MWYCTRTCQRKHWKSHKFECSPYAGRAPALGPTEAGSTPAPAPASTEAPDHEKLQELAREARKKGNMFYYFPEAGENLKKDFETVDKEIESDEAKKEAFADLEPEKSVFAFFEVLESRNQERQARLKETQPAAKLESKFSSAGRPHDVVHENGYDEEWPEDTGAETPVAEPAPPAPAAAQVAAPVAPPVVRPAPRQAPPVAAHPEPAGAPRPNRTGPVPGFPGFR